MNTLFFAVLLGKGDTLVTDIGAYHLSHHPYTSVILNLIYTVQIICYPLIIENLFLSRIKSHNASMGGLKQGTLDRIRKYFRGVILAVDNDSVQADTDRDAGKNFCKCTNYN